VDSETAPVGIDQALMQRVEIKAARAALEHARANATLQQVRAALPSLDQSYRTQYPNKIDSGFTTTLRTLPEDVTQNFRAGFITLFAAVCFVLLIACSNVANLLLVRFSGRRREIALRMAIGASRAGIIRLFVLESLLVSIFAGGAGAFVAWRSACSKKWRETFFRLKGTQPVFRSRFSSSRLIVNRTGLLMGVIQPQASRADLADGPKEGGRGSRQCAAITVPQDLVGAQGLSVTSRARAC
jgi:hypothetical protein